MKTLLLLVSLAATPAAVAQAPAKFEITRSDTISFTLTVPGGYPFICTTPGIPPVIMDSNVGSGIGGYHFQRWF